MCVSMKISPVLGVLLLASPLLASAMVDGDNDSQDPVALCVFARPVQSQDSMGSMGSGGNEHMLSPLSLGSPLLPGSSRPPITTIPDGVGFLVGIVPASTFTSAPLGSYYDEEGKRRSARVKPPLFPLTR